MRSVCSARFAIAALVLATAGLLRTARAPDDPGHEGHATDFGNEGGVDALKGSGGAIF